MASERTSPALIEHLKKEHRVSPLQTYLKEIVYGGTDGIVTTFAVVAGFAGANLGGNIPGYSFLTVLLFGLANLVADGASMGLGNFLSLRAEQDVYRSEQKKERHEIQNNKELEKKETITILMHKGFSKKQAEDLTAIYMTNENYWLQFMMNYELELANPLDENPIFTGLATFAAFITFGFIPLLPFFFIPITSEAFTLSLSATLSALVLLGILRWRITRETITRSIFEIVIVGSVAAFLAYMVGTFFRE